MAVLRMLQDGKVLSLELAQAIAHSIVGSMAEILTPRLSPQGLRSGDGLAWSLALLKAAEHSDLMAELLRVSLKVLSMHAQSLPWVQNAAERLALSGHLSEVRHLYSTPSLPVLQPMWKSLLLTV